jgi:hypothetical protein
MPLPSAGTSVNMLKNKHINRTLAQGTFTPLIHAHAEPTQTAFTGKPNELSVSKEAKH